MNRFFPRDQKQNKPFLFFCLILGFFRHPEQSISTTPKSQYVITESLTFPADLSQFLLPKFQINLGKKYREEVLVAPNT